MTKPNLILFVDNREPANTVERIHNYGINAISTRMDAGDYMFVAHNKKILIERKTISDLLGSLASKRLVSQAHRMIEDCDSPWLLREGAFGRNPGGNLEYYSPRDPRANSSGYVISGWNWDSYSGMMIDLQLMGLQIFDCPVLGEYPTEIARLAINLSKEDHRWIQERERPQVISVDPQFKNVVWALSAHDGIGPELAEGLLGELGSLGAVYELAVTDPDKLAKIKVNGRKLGKKALRLHEEVIQSWK